MNIIEQMQSLDTNDIGRWPMVFRAALIGLIFLVVSAGGSYYFVYRVKAPMLQDAEAKEAELKVTYKNRWRRAANLDAYKEQLQKR